MIKLIQSYVGEVIHGYTGAQLYRCWKNMRSRCYNVKSSRYYCYGEKGIVVCDEWADFVVFKDWALTNGYEKDLTIDRKAPNGNYNPDNCRWISYEQNHDEMMEFNLKHRTGIFSESSQLKSKESHRRNSGKSVSCSKNGNTKEFGSRGEMIDFLVHATGRKRDSIKAHVSQCLTGKSETLSGYTIDDLSGEKYEQI